MKTKYVMMLLVCFIVSSHVWKLHRNDILKKYEQLNVASKLKQIALNTIEYSTVFVIGSQHKG